MERRAVIFTQLQFIYSVIYELLVKRNWSELICFGELNNFWTLQLLFKISLSWPENILLVLVVSQLTVQGCLLFCPWSGQTSGPASPASVVTCTLHLDISNIITVSLVIFFLATNCTLAFKCPSLSSVFARNCTEILQMHLFVIHLIKQHLRIRWRWTRRRK